MKTLFSIGAILVSLICVPFPHAEERATIVTAHFSGSDRYPDVRSQNTPEERRATTGVIGPTELVQAQPRKLQSLFERVPMISSR